MTDLEKESKHTYYLSKIPKITRIHPLIQEKYDKELETWYKKKFLETPFLSDQAKISSIKMFKPEYGDILEKGVVLAKKTDKFFTNVGNKYSSLPKATTLEAQKVYDENYYNNLGGKKYKKNNKNKRTKKNKITKKNKRGKTHYRR
jgi:hypothetical protein